MGVVLSGKIGLVLARVNDPLYPGSVDSDQLMVLFGDKFGWCLSTYVRVVE